MPTMDRSPLDNLESAAQVLANRALYAAAIGVYAKLAAQAPGHSMAWFGMADGLFHFSAAKQDPQLLLLGLACVRRALREDRDNAWAVRLERTMELRTPLTAEQFAACEAFAGEPQEVSRQVGYSAASLVDGVRTGASWEERMLLMSWLGRHGDEDFVELLLSGARDDHEEVQLEALEHLASFGARADVRGCLEQMVSAEGPRHRARDAALGAALSRIGELHAEHAAWADELQQALTP